MSLETLLTKEINIKQLQMPELENRGKFLIPEPELKPETWDIIKNSYKETVANKKYEPAITMLAAIQIFSPEKIEFITDQNRQILLKQVKQWNNSIRRIHKRILDYDYLESVFEAAVSTRIVFPEIRPNSLIKKPDFNELSHELKDSFSLYRLMYAKSLFPDKFPQLLNTLAQKLSTLDDYLFYANLNNDGNNSSYWLYERAQRRLLFPEQYRANYSDKDRKLLTSYFEIKCKNMGSRDDEKKTNPLQLLWALRDLHILNASEAFIDENGDMKINNNPKTPLSTIPEMPHFKKL